MGSINGDSAPSPESALILGSSLFDGDTVESLTLTFRRNTTAEDIEFFVEVSADLEDWETLDSAFVSSVPNNDGTETVTYRSLSDVALTNREFIRLRVLQTP